MHLNALTLLTSNLEQLSDFYSRLFDKEPDFSKDDKFRQFTFDDMQISIWAKNEFYDVLETGKLSDVKIIQGNAGQVYPVILNFTVDNIDSHCDTSKNKGFDILKEITTTPWKNTSYWIRDPEGNIINFAQKK